MKPLIIKCPLCNYQPSQNDQWICDCGNIFDTFLTAARCTRCGKQHENTCCPNPKCRKWSKHLRWYVPELDKLLKNEMKSINANKKPNSNENNNES